MAIQVERAAKQEATAVARSAKLDDVVAALQSGAEVHARPLDAEAFARIIRTKGPEAITSAEIVRIIAAVRQQIPTANLPNVSNVVAQITEKIAKSQSLSILRIASG